MKSNSEVGVVFTLFNQVNGDSKKIKGRCYHCKKLLLKTSLPKHVRICIGDTEKLFLCDIDGCESTFRTLHDRNVHERQVHQLSVPCPYENCGLYIKPAYLKKHIANVHINAKTLCNFCNRKILIDVFPAHIMACANENMDKIECPVEGCSRLLKSSVSLNKHLKMIHNNNNSGQCYICGKMMNKHYLNKHISICSGDGEKIFNCVVEGCSSSFRTIQDRNCHLYCKHSDSITDYSGNVKKKSKCKYCNLYLLKCNLERHEQLCEDRKRNSLKCNVDGCEKSFQTLTEKRAHVRKVHILPVKCPYEGCSSIIKPYCLPRHFKLTHNLKGGK